MSATTPREQTRQAKTKRIAVRVTEELETKINRAIALSGLTQTEFVSEALAEKADEVIRAQHYIDLSQRDMEALLNAIENPPEPNVSMRRSAARWQERLRSSR